ncbi:MAG: hypothetical protein R3Y59_09200 [bacterium]
MGDTTFYYLSYQAANEALENNDLINAMTEFFWTIEMGEYGDPYGFGEREFIETQNDAINKYRELAKKIDTPILSKTSFIQGCQCQKLIWLYKYKYNKQVISEETKSKFKRGNIIGDLAQHLFPNSVDIIKIVEPNTKYTIDQSLRHMPTYLKQQLWLRETQKLLAAAEYNQICEAAFMYDKVYSAIDILTIENDKRIAYEVKSVTKINDVHIKDSALQYYVINNNLPLSDFYLIYINEEYLNSLNMPMQDLTLENCDINQLFKRESIIDEVKNLQPYIKENIDKFKLILKNRNKEPVIKSGAQCDTPYECAFKRYCNVRR